MGRGFQSWPKMTHLKRLGSCEGFRQVGYDEASSVERGGSGKHDARRRLVGVVNGEARKRRALKQSDHHY